MRFGRCIPVIVGDGMRQPFDEVLDYDAFSIRLSEAQFASNLTAALDAVSPSRVAALRAGLACVWRFFTYSSVWGAAADEGGLDDAWAMAMEVLRERLPGQAPRPEFACEGARLPAGHKTLCKAPLCSDGLMEHVPYGNALTGPPVPDEPESNGGGRGRRRR